MKVTVTVAGQTYQVEIANLHARPVLAVVDGETFEVWPEEETTTLEAPASRAMNTPSSSASPPIAPTVSSPSRYAATAPSVDGQAAVVRAPIPGVIVAISVQSGATVTVGQELCVLEAMKMENTIRAPRAGTIAAVCVTVDQHVKRQDVLVEYAP
ncbi:MAG: acetyl-CoA carboxylase biotin carboxyl carrier protein subunit [Chloroflexales bacterium]|nr:acetyl-CoA carboxylase biotin carboxyl carrier protein subunit [Chloroflexales bacterium]